jgi:hypothetical protein
MNPYEIHKTAEALESIGDLCEQRTKTIKNQREQRIVDDLIRRGFAVLPECEWDRKHNQNWLVVLALKPSEVGWVFKVREYLHRPIHRFICRQG